MTPPRPILTLDFAGAGRIDRRLVFTRASRGVRLTPQGRLRAAPPGQPRLDAAPAGGSHGLLLEPAAANLLPYGAGLAWADCQPTTESVQTGLPAPDGSLTACRVASPSAVSLHPLRLEGPPEPGPYTGSLYVRPAGGTGLCVSLFCYDQGAYPLDGRALVDLAGGVLLPGSTPDTTLEPAGDGWFRLTLRTAAPIYGTAVFLLVVTPDPTAPTPCPEGAACAVDVWGAQLESGAAASSFIATGSGAAARAADACSLSLALVRGWTPAEGTLLVEGTLRTAAGAPQTLAALTGGEDGLALRVLDGGAVRAGAVADGGALAPGTVAAGTRWRAALAWRADGLAACLDGGAVAADGTGPPAGLSTLHLGGRAGAEPAGGWIARVALYRQRLSDALLQWITRP